MKLAYFPSYCGGRILTGLSRNFINPQQNGTIHMSVAAVLTSHELKAESGKTDLARGIYQGRSIDRVGGAPHYIPKEDLGLEEIRNILAQNSLVQVTRLAVARTDANGYARWEVEEGPKGFSRSWNQFSTTIPGQPGRQPFPPFCSYVPSDIETFQAALYAMLRANGDFKYVYAVTSPGQNEAREYLEKSGFKMIGKGAKNEMSNSCENWQGDSKEIMPIMGKAMDKYYGLLGPNYDSYAQRLGIKAIRKPVEKENAA